MKSTTEGDPAPDWGWAHHHQEQLRFGLRLTPGERIEWLERVYAELLPLLGLARGQRSRG
jgi:hypothetical protein